MNVYKLICLFAFIISCVCFSQVRTQSPIGANILRSLAIAQSPFYLPSSGLRKSLAYNQCEINNTEVIQESWDETIGAWRIAFARKISFNATNGCRTETLVDQIFPEKVTSVFDNSHNLKMQLIEILDTISNSYVPTQRRDWWYGPNNLIDSSCIYEDWNKEKVQWGRFDLQRATYDSTRLSETIEKRSYDASSGQWLKNTLFKISYDPSLLIRTEIRSIWNASHNTWEYSSAIKADFDPDENIGQLILSTFENGIFYKRMVFSTDRDITNRLWHLNTCFYEFPDTIKANCSQQTTYYYNAAGCDSVNEDRIWVDSTKSWRPLTKETFYYSGSTTLKKLRNQVWPIENLSKDGCLWFDPSGRYMKMMDDRTAIRKKATRFGITAGGRTKLISLETMTKIYDKRKSAILAGDANGSFK